MDTHHRGKYVVPNEPILAIVLQAQCIPSTELMPKRHNDLITFGRCTQTKNIDFMDIHVGLNIAHLVIQ